MNWPEIRSYWLTDWFLRLTNFRSYDSWKPNIIYDSGMLKIYSQVEVNSMYVPLIWHFNSRTEEILRIMNKVLKAESTVLQSNSGHEYIHHSYGDRDTRGLCLQFSQRTEKCVISCYAVSCVIGRCFTSWSSKNNDITMPRQWITFMYWIIEIIHFNPPKKKIDFSCLKNEKK